MQTIILFITVIFVLMPGPVCAEKVHLRTGRVIQVDSLHQEGDYLIISQGELKQKFFMDEVLRIEKDPVDEDFIPRGLYDDVDFTDNIPREPFRGFLAIPENKRDLIIRFMEVGGMRDNLEVNLQQVLISVSEEKRPFLAELFNVDEIMERMAPIFDQQYTQKELIELINFFESPTGVKMRQVTPVIMKEGVRASAQYIKSRLE